MTFKEDITKPFNLISLSIGLIALILGICFYYSSKKTKSISYYVNEPSSLIYDSHNSSSAIKVLEHDSIPIKDNVYLVTGIIWNSGDLPISMEDVREKMHLNLNSAKKILDFRIVKQLDPEIAQFTLKMDRGNSIIVNWKYFDPGYAFKFQVIYTGTENSNFNLSGKILDINNFEQTNSTDENQDFIPKIGEAVSTALSGILLYLLRRKNDRLRTKNSRYSKMIEGVIFFALVLMGIIIFGLVVYQVKEFMLPKVPFLDRPSHVFF